MPTAQASADAGCLIGEQVTLPITFVGPEQRPTIPGTIDGKPAAVLLDTGSRATTLSRPALEKLGIQVRSEETNYAGVDILMANVPNVSVGPISVKGWFTVLESKDDIGVKLGANYLAGSDLELWWANKEVRFSKPSGCRKTFLASWDPAAGIVPFEIDHLRKDLRPWFKVRINGTDVDAIISTRSPYSYLDLHTAARLGITPETPGVTEDGELTSWRDKRYKVWKAPVTEMSIGSYKVPNPSIRLFDMTLSGEMLVLGADFLRNHRLLISMSQRRIYITHLGGPSFSDPEGELR
jgi:predicted aspartyl protease